MKCKDAMVIVLGADIPGQKMTKLLQPRESHLLQPCGCMSIKYYAINTVMLVVSACSGLQLVGLAVCSHAHTKIAPLYIIYICIYIPHTAVVCQNKPEEKVEDACEEKHSFQDLKGKVSVPCTLRVALIHVGVTLVCAR